VRQGNQERAQRRRRARRGTPINHSSNPTIILGIVGDVRGAIAARLAPCRARLAAAAAPQQHGGAAGLCPITKWPARAASCCPCPARGA